MHSEIPNLREIKSLAQNGCYAEALAACDLRLIGSEIDQDEVLRTRAYINTLRGDYQAAIADRELVLSRVSERDSLKDLYLCATYAIEAGDFTLAKKRFLDTIRVGDLEDVTWFKSASLFLLAYARMKLGEYVDAIRDLENAVSIEADVAMPLPFLGMCNARQLRQEISSRRNGM